MGNTLESFNVPTLFEIETIILDNKVLFSRILTVTVSASLLVISLKKLHKFGFFSTKDKKPIQWKKVGKIDKLLMYPLKGAKELEQNVSYFGPMGMQSEDDLHDRSFMLVDENRYAMVI